jgi:DNA-binding response OmpR family regulator
MISTRAADAYAGAVTAKLQVLVVEDEAPIRAGLCDVLAFRGYAPVGADTGDDGLREASRGCFALVLLDVMLPGLSGFDVCRALRERIPDQPILMLTARGAEADVLEGFRCGADDYVTKPFSVAELMMRVEALLRRSGRLPSQAETPFAFAGWHVDPTSRTAARDDARIELSRLEVGLLALLARERGRIVSRRTLLRAVWGLQHVDGIQTRTVDVHVAKLRRKLGLDERGVIETVRGEGYRFSG